MRSSHALSQPELRHRMGDGSAVKPMVKRRVSRVESLRNLFFSRGSGGGGGGGQQQGASSGLEARKRFLLKKRARSAEKEKVRKRDTFYGIQLECEKLAPSGMGMSSRNL